MNDRGFSNGGAMFPRQKKSDNGPDFGGDFTIDGELTQHVIEQIRAGAQIKIEISGWKRTDRNGKPFMSLKVRKPWVREGVPPIQTDPFGASAPVPAQAPKPAYANKGTDSPPFFDEQKAVNGDGNPWE